MIILINDRGELYIMVAPGEEQAVTVAESCSGRSAGESERTPALTSSLCVCVRGRACCVLPGCWRGFDSWLVPGFVLGRENFEDD